jgi:uncharacterized protein (DUF1330 family)
MRRFTRQMAEPRLQPRIREDAAGLRLETLMSAYVIVDIEVTDPVRYEEYKRRAAPTVHQFGGRYLVRGGKVEALEGERIPHRIVVLEFPTMERAREWWDAADYRPARALRQACARTEMVRVAGV